MSSELLFQFAHAGDEAAVRSLLAACGLPDADICEHISNFLLARSGNDLTGCVGLELYADEVLLRSLAVAEPMRGQGLGKMLTLEILRYAEHLEAGEVYLLTTTAEHFFEKFGFLRVSREQAPNGVRNSKEFTSLCPSTAVLMRKTLVRPQSRNQTNP